MEHPESLKFNFEFAYDGIKYIAYVTPVIELTEHEKKIHLIRENSFLVHLLEPERMITFEMFIGEDLEWQTSASSFMVDEELLGEIGDYIDSKFR